MELSSDHTMKSVLALSCLGQPKECTEVPILLIAAFLLLFGGQMGWGGVLMNSGRKDGSDPGFSSSCCGALTKLKSSHLSSCFVSSLLALNL